MASSQDELPQQSDKVANLEAVEKADTPTEHGSAPINQMEIQAAPAFVGLGKEDLLVLAGRPFWVRLRWALFFTFWILWLGLLVGASLIIALSPGCEKDEVTDAPAGTGGHR